MRVFRASDYDEMSRIAAGILTAHITLEPSCTVGLATGSTPAGIYRRLAQRFIGGEIDFSDVTFFNLDEYVGLSPDDPHSYKYYMQENLYRHINAAPANINIPNGMAGDLEAECRRYDAALGAHPIDVQLLGIGHDGHIGFNEPDTVFHTGTHTVELARDTIEANSRFFHSLDDVPKRAVTMGVLSIMRAKRILLAVSGEDKAEILSRALTGPVTPEIPASLLQLHGNVTLVADADALKAVDTDRLNG